MQLLTIPLRNIFYLASKDLLYDKKVSACIVASLISVIAPLLLLFSLKFGIVSAMQEKLIQDPVNSELIIIGNRELNRDFFSWLAKQPELGFAVALTRSLNLEAFLRKDNNHFIENVEILPTAVNDPLNTIGVQLTDNKQVILSTKAARKLQLKVGEEVQLIVQRTLDEQQETAVIKLKVVGVLEDRLFVRDAAFVNLDLLVKIENFKDGYQEPSLNITTGAEVSHQKDVFAKARIYAKNIDLVAPLAEKLQDKYNIETQTRIVEIDKVKSIDKTLSYLFIIIAIAAIIGCVLSLIGAVLSNVDRKRKDLAFLQLIGFASKAIISYLILQSMLLSCIAYGGAVLVYFIGRQLLNAKFDLSSMQINNNVSTLSPLHLILALIITLAIAILVAIYGGQKASEIEPAENLREI